MVLEEQVFDRVVDDSNLHLIRIQARLVPMVEVAPGYEVDSRKVLLKTVLLERADDRWYFP
jgi:hypothetical protein